MTARPDKHDPATLGTDTWAVHGGNQPDRTTGAIRTPIVMADSHRLPCDPATPDDADRDLSQTLTPRSPRCPASPDTEVDPALRLDLRST